MKRYQRLANSSVLLATPNYNFSTEIGITLICHVGAGSLCLLAARPVEVRWRAVCLPEEFSAHKG